MNSTENSLPGFARYQVPFILWAILIFVGSSIPSVSMPKLSILTYDKLLHVFVFFVLAVLAHRAFTHQEKYRWLRNNALLGTFLFTAAYGLFDEVHQGFVPGRESSVSDFVADSLGGGILVCIIWFKSRKSAGQEASNS